MLSKFFIVGHRFYRRQSVASERLREHICASSRGSFQSAGLDHAQRVRRDLRWTRRRAGYVSSDDDGLGANHGEARSASRWSCGPLRFSRHWTRRGAAALVQQLARQVDAQMPWGAATAPSAARCGRRQGVAATVWHDPVVERRGRHSGAVLLRGGAGGRVPRGDGHVRERSWEVSAWCGMPQVPAKPVGPVTFATWTDPRRERLQRSVPQGWKAVGGTYRLSATDIRSGVTLASPDGQIRVRDRRFEAGDVHRAKSDDGLRGNPRRDVLQAWRRVEVADPAVHGGPAGCTRVRAKYVSRESGPADGFEQRARRPGGDLGQRARGEGMPNARLTAGE